MQVSSVSGLFCCSGGGDSNYGSRGTGSVSGGSSYAPSTGAGTATYTDAPPGVGHTGSSYSDPSGTAAGGTGYSPSTVGTGSRDYGSGAPVTGSGPGFSGPTAGTVLQLSGDVYAWMGGNPWVGGNALYRCEIRFACLRQSSVLLQHVVLMIDGRCGMQQSPTLLQGQSSTYLLNEPYCETVSILKASMVSQRWLIRGTSRTFLLAVQIEHLTLHIDITLSTVLGHSNDVTICLRTSTLQRAVSVQFAESLEWGGYRHSRHRCGHRQCPAYW